MYVFTKAVFSFHYHSSMSSIYTMPPKTGEFGMPQQFHGDNKIKSVVVPELAVTVKALWKED